MKKSALLALLAASLLPLPALAQDEGAAPGEQVSPLDEAKKFVASFCAAIKDENEGWLRGRVKLPLNARLAVAPEGGGSNRVQHLTLRTSKQVIEARLCDGLNVEKASVSTSTRGFTVKVPGKSLEATLELERSPRVRLVSFLER